VLVDQAQTLALALREQFDGVVNDRRAGCHWW
jgi:hypothetical protein